jgi:hypothetical protein
MTIGCRGVSFPRRRESRWSDRRGDADQQADALRVLLINIVEIELTWSVKSPLTPLYQRGVIPPFAKEPVLSLSKERSGGIYVDRKTETL